MSDERWRMLMTPDRVGAREPGKIAPQRSPFQRDFDRIVFSGSFRRLQDKTQVFPLVKTDYVRTRLTHSLETSSVGRSLGSAAGVFLCENFDMGEVRPSDVGAVVAAACLAHDIGNPPLGHAGEEAIRYWFTHSDAARELHGTLSAARYADIERYEGNAQGFRVLCRLEMPDRKGGMQLTCATLGALAKYPGSSCSKFRKFGFFQSESGLFAEVAEHCGLLRTAPEEWARHPLSYLVEAADDITYLIVDFEDGMRLGLIPSSELEESFLAILDSPAARVELETIGTPQRRAEFLRAKVIGELVRQTVRAFVAHHDELLRGTMAGPLLDFTPAIGVLNTIRRRSEESIYNHRRVVEVIAAGFEMVSGMLDIFYPCANELAAERLGGPPASSRARRIGAILPEFGLSGPEAGDPYLRLLRVLDYVSSMTDGYAVRLYQRLKGISL